MILWRPTPNSDKYVYASQLSQSDEESDDDPIPDDEDKVETVKPSIRDPEYMTDYRPKCEFMNLIF